MSATRHGNVHGRKWGRGVRPYLLLPKIVCVATFLGGLVSLLVLLLLPEPPQTREAWIAQAELVRRGFGWVIVPSATGAVVFGSLLLRCHFRVFLRMRWVRVKLALIAVFVPGLHLFMRSRSIRLARLVEGDGDLAEAAVVRGELAAGTLAALGFVLVVIFLGRIKPRLGQRYGRTFASTRGSSGKTGSA